MLWMVILVKLYSTPHAESSHNGRSTDRGTGEAPDLTLSLSGGRRRSPPRRGCAPGDAVAAASAAVVPPSSETAISSSWVSSKAGGGGGGGGRAVTERARSASPRYNLAAASRMVATQAASPAATPPELRKS